MRRRSFTVTVCALVVLAGCATTSAPPAPPDWPAHRESLRQLTHWEARGKLALRSAQQSESASFHWRQAGERVTLHLSGPLGVNAATLETDGRRLTIRRGDDIEQWDIEAGGYLHHESGWKLPLNALPYWIRGLPDPDQTVQHLQLDQTGTRLLLLNQGDWVVRVDSYDYFDQLVLPTRLALDNGTTSAIILIRQWTPEAGR